MEWHTILLSVLSSGFTATVLGTYFTWHVTDKLDSQQRRMERRKEIYSDTTEALAGLYDTASASEREEACKKLLFLHRQAQLWASSDVVIQFNKLIQALDLKKASTQTERNTQCTNLILVMRKELAGEEIEPFDIHRYGKII